MTAPDSRDSVERVVDDMRENFDAAPNEVFPASQVRDWMKRLQALARGPQQAGGEDAEDARHMYRSYVAAQERAETAEAALREAHTLPETWRNKWDGGCCCDAAGHECADALDAAIGGTGDA